MNRARWRARLASVLTRLGVEPGEGAALAWAFLSFFALLSGYYLLRPVREAVIAGDARRLIPLVFTSVFFVMLVMVPIYGALVSRFPRRRFLPFVYAFAIVVLIGFAIWFRLGLTPLIAAVSFAIFLSVLNLFVDSVFWSFMSDIFTNAQSKRLYGMIAAGGTAGAIAGPMFTAFLAREIGVSNLLFCSAGMFGVCLLAIVRLIPWARRQEASHQREDGEHIIGGSIFAGAQLVFQRPLLIALVLFMLLGVSIGTLLYNQQADVIGKLIPDRDTRTEFFGSVDLAINVLVLLVQITSTRFLMTRYGVGPMLLIPAVLVVLGLTSLALMHGPMMVTIVQVITRGGSFALVKPARESLFTRVDRESRYKAKNFIDTVVYRGGDMATSNAYSALSSIGMTLAQIAATWIAVALAWLWVVLWLLRLVKKLPEEHGAKRDE